MSNVVPVIQVLETLNGLVAAAFGGGIDNERPRTVRPAETIVIEPVSIDISKDGEEASFTKTHEEHRFAIVIRQKMPPAAGNPDLTIAMIKLDNFIALRSVVQNQAAWAGIANYPMITRVIWPDPDKPYEGTIETQALFSCQTGTSFF